MLWYFGDEGDGCLQKSITCGWGGGGEEGDSGVKQSIRQGAWLGENERGREGRQHGQEREG